MIELYANNAQSTIASPITNTSVSVQLSVGSGSLFPSPSAGEFFRMTFVDAATGLQREIVYCTARSGDVCTIERAQEGTIAKAWNVGDVAASLPTAGSLSNLVQSLQLQESTATYAVDTGSANNYVAAYSPAIPAAQDGMTLQFKASHANTSASTFAVDALSAQPIVNPEGNPLVGGEIAAGSIVAVQWNSSIGSGAWIIQGVLQLSASTGDTLIGSKPPDSPSGKTLPATTLDIYVKSSPINLATALPGNYVTNGSVDYSAYVQPVIDYLKDYGGGKIIIPAHITILIKALTGCANLEIEGQGWSSILKVAAGYIGIDFDSGSSSSSLSGIRFANMQMLGDCVASGFSQFKHLITFNGVSDGLLENVKLAGFQGDGLYIGSSNTGGLERHNKSIVVCKSLFDGLNNANRNGISVIDCDTLDIVRCDFENCTTSTMPGPIDVEPDSAYNVIRNVNIERNNFKNSGGQLVIGALSSSALSLTTTPKKITVKSNYIDASCTGANILVRSGETVSTSLTSMDVLVENNTANGSGSAFALSKIRGARLIGNTFNGSTVGEIGDATNASNTWMDVTYQGNTHNGGGNSVGQLQIASGQSLKMYGNWYVSPTGQQAVTFFGSGVTTISSDVSISSDTFVTGASQVRSYHLSGHTLTTSTNYYYGGTVIGTALTSKFTGRGVGEEHVSANKGANNATLTAGKDEETQVWNSALASSYTATLDTTSTPYDGAHFRVVRTANATGAGVLHVGALKDLTTAGTYADVTYSTAFAAWILTGSGSL